MLVKAGCAEGVKGARGWYSMTGNVLNSSYGVDGMKLARHPRHVVC